MEGESKYSMGLNGLQRDMYEQDGSLFLAKMSKFLTKTRTSHSNTFLQETSAFIF